MKNLFIRYHRFWVISKIIIALLLAISALVILSEERLKADEKWVNVVGLIEALLLAVTLIPDFSKGTLRMISGAVLILFGLGVLGVLLTVSEGAKSDFYFLGYPFAIWMLLVGVFDVLKVNRS